MAYEWWTSYSGPVEIRVIPAAGVTAMPQVVYRIQDIYQLQGLAWLPDGTRILADILRPDMTHQILLIRSDGTSATPLKTFDWRLSNKMSVSPDGRYLAYDLAPNEDNPEHDNLRSGRGR